MLRSRACNQREKYKNKLDWRFTLEQIGPGLRTFYPTPENLPPELSTILTLYCQMELTKQELTNAQCESRKLVAHIKEVLARQRQVPQQFPLLSERDNSRLCIWFRS